MLVLPKSFLSKVFSIICLGLLSIFVLAVISSAVLRYLFALGSVKLEDVIGYSFSTLIIFSVLVAFLKGVHVRVKMFSSKETASGNFICRIAGALPFLAIAILSFSSVSFSWMIFEGSNEPGGLGGLFLIKTCLPVSFCFIALFLCFNKSVSR